MTDGSSTEQVTYRITGIGGRVEVEQVVVVGGGGGRTVTGGGGGGGGGGGVGGVGCKVVDCATGL